MSISPDNQLKKSSGASAPQNGDVSEQEEEVEEDEEEVFEVEAILEERRIMSVTKYLVKWAGYDLMNATWEPAEQFDSSDTLKDWARKKPLIEIAKERRFDVKRWERDQKRIEAEFVSSGKDLIADNATLNTDFDSYFIPLPVPANTTPPPPANNVRSRRESRVSISSDTSLFVSANTVSPGQPPAPGPVPQEDPAEHAPDASQPAQITRTVPGALASIAPNGVTQQRADNRADNPAEIQAPKRTALITSHSGSRPQVPPAKPSVFQSGQIARPSHKRPGGDAQLSGRERVPDISQLELLKPSEFPSRENNGHLSITHKAGTGKQQPKNDHLPSGASEAASTALAPTDPPGSLLATGARHLNGISGIQSPSTTIRPAQSPATMEKAGRLSLRDRSPDADNPPRLPDFAKRHIAAAGNIRRRSPGASRQKPPSVYSRREPSGVSSPQRSLDPDNRRRSPDAHSRRESLGSFRPGGDCYRPGERERPGGRDIDSYRPSDPGHRNEQLRSSGTAFPKSPSHHHQAVHLPNVTSTYGQSYHEIARRNSISVTDRGQMPSPVTAPGPFNQPVISGEEKDQIAQMPLGIPDDTVCFVKDGYFYNKSDHEILAHVYFGVDKKYIGPVRLCGHRVAAKYDLLRNGNPREMWFKDLCTWDEYEELSRDVSDTVSFHSST